MELNKTELVSKYENEVLTTGHDWINFNTKSTMQVNMNKYRTPGT